MIQPVRGGGSGALASRRLARREPALSGVEGSRRRVTENVWSLAGRAVVSER